jgi:drug/metabolite transporter (DMT)-like permease
MIRTTTPTRFALLAAFASIYLIWGSTYLAIVFAIHSMPPLLMLGARFGVAGLLLLGWAIWRGLELPSAREWLNATIVGTLTLGVGVGSVAWAEEWVPSGVAALLVTTVPLWIVLIEWKWRSGPRPNRYVWSGLILGLVGILLLVNPADANLQGSRELLGALAILVAAFVFSVGAILGRDLQLPSLPAMSTATQMIGGGTALALAGLMKGEASELDMAAITMESWIAWGYLMFFGSIVAYGSFVWLMKHVSASRVSTYAYVNPIVAVFLGWAMAGEALNGRVLAAVLLLVGAVVLITRFGDRRKPLRPVTRVLRPRGVVKAFAHSMDRPATSLPETRTGVGAWEA